MSPNLEDGYWNHVDQVIKMAEKLGIYMGLLPFWSNCYVKNGLDTKDNFITYINFITNRYVDYPNIIWIMGGDIRGSVDPSLFHFIGENIKRNNKEKLISFHPFGRTSSSMWFHNASWLDFNMFQSGHRRYDQSNLDAWDDNSSKEKSFGEDNYKYVLRDHSYDIKKPTLDGEPSYEQIVQGLHDESQPYWQACDVRRYAYWSVFAGALGHTYGDNSVMQFHDKISIKGNYGAKDHWKEAIHHEGSSHMKHLTDLMNSLDFAQGAPAQELLVGEIKEKYERVAVFASENYILGYDYLGEEMTLDLSSYREKEMLAYWFDPTTGVYSYFTTINDKTILSFRPYRRKNGINDWVLVLVNKQQENMLSN